MNDPESTPRPNEDPEEAVQDLLVELFSDPPDALRQAHALRYAELVEAIDWSGPPRSQAYGLVRQLVQHGVLQRGPGGERSGPRAYFELLVAERPRQHARISAVAMLWGVTDLARSPELPPVVARRAWTRRASTWWIAGGLVLCAVFALVQRACLPQQFGESCGDRSPPCAEGLQCADGKCLRAVDGRCATADDCAAGECVDARCGQPLARP